MHKHFKIWCRCKSLLSLTVGYWRPSDPRESSDPQRSDPSGHWSARARDNTVSARTNTRSRLHAYNTITWTMKPLFFLPNSDAHMRTLHRLVSLLFPKIPCSCFLSLRLCVFLCTPEFLFVFTFFPKQGKGKQKHNERIKKDYRLSEVWNSEGLCVCSACICVEEYVYVWVYMFGRKCTWVVCVYM